MKLSFVLGHHGIRPDSLECTSTVTMDKVGEAMLITAIHMDLKAQVPGIDEALFNTCTEDAKTDHPMRRALKSVTFALSATLA
jgi:osmotically inducible protein OsmC